MTSTGLTEQEKERLIKSFLTKIVLHQAESGEYYITLNESIYGSKGEDKFELFPGEEKLYIKAMDNLLKSVWGF